MGKLFDHLVSEREQSCRNLDAERFCGPLINRDLKFGGLHNGQICWLFAVQNLAGLDTYLTISSSEARSVAHQKTDRHQSRNVGSVQPPQTQGKVQSAVRFALSGRYLLQGSARTGLIDCQTTSKFPEEFILPIMAGLER